jgi:GntR family transcriptional regulator of arabinose operon
MPNVLKRGIGLPLYAQIKQKIMADIDEGILGTNDYLPTLKDLSAMYGVSLMTCNKAVSDLVREGYLIASRGARTRVSDRRKKGLFPTGLKGHIGVFFHCLEGEGEKSIDMNKAPWTSAIYASMQENMLAGYSFTMMPVRDNEKDLWKVISDTGNFDGFILFPLPYSSKLLMLVERTNKPYVTVNRWSEEINHNYVMASYYQGSAEVADYLIDAGINSFLVLMLNTYRYSQILKIRGFQEALMRRGVSLSRLDIREANGSHLEAGKEALRAYWQEKGRMPEAIFSHGDYLAMGAIEFCQELGLKVPEDVSVIGSTGTDMSEKFNPALSVLKAPMWELGQTAMRMLCQMMKEGVSYLPGREIPMHFILRDTVKRKEVIRT